MKAFSVKMAAMKQLLLLMSAVAGLGVNAMADARISYQITGYVHDSNGSPIAHVGVGANLVNGTNQVYVDTDNNGNYTLSAPVNGTWVVSVNCSSGSNSLANVGSGYLCCNSESVIIANASGIVNFTTPAFGDSELSGTILDGNNKPLAAVTVYITSEDTNNSYLDDSTVTDANGFYQFSITDGYWDVSVNCTNLNSLGFNCLDPQLGVGVGGGQNTPGVNFVAQATGVPMPFFTGQVALGNNVYFLANNPNNFYGYYSLQNFPYVYHFNLGFEYFIDANNSNHGAYIYDFTSGHFWYTSPGTLPYIYDFTLNSWLYCYSSSISADTYLSNPRTFYNFSTGQPYFN